jgi:hypothetical protein
VRHQYFSQSEFIKISWSYFGSSYLAYPKPGLQWVWYSYRHLTSHANESIRTIDKSMSRQTLFAPMSK